MSKAASERSRKHAAYLKDHRIERTTGQCPWGCGRAIQNGGGPLMNHLNFCHGKRKK